jgi:hypothetical protein
MSLEVAWQKSRNENKVDDFDSFANPSNSTKKIIGVIVLCIVIIIIDKRISFCTLDITPFV